MTPFTAWQYLLIDVANQFGLDKERFETRIQWAEDNLNQLEELASEAETQPLYIKAVQAIRKAQQRIPTGHLVGFDASCSGIQIMSAITGCWAGARATGLIDPDRRADAYTDTTTAMNQILGGTLEVSRKDAKAALMTSFYGSKKTPETIFGSDTPELDAFYEAANTIAPGAWELLQDLLKSWQRNALMHAWQLPDGFEARIKVMQKVEDTRIEVDELDHATFTYTYYVNQGSKRGLSNAANVVHSIDAYVLRCIQRRCNYDREMVERVHGILDTHLTEREQVGLTPSTQDIPEKLAYYLTQYQRSGIADVVILPHVDQLTVWHLPTPLLQKLHAITAEMLTYRPFAVLTVHDEFKCHPNHMNHLRQQYNNILADLADSDIVSDILSQIHGVAGTFPKLSTNLGAVIRNANYALC